MKKGILKRLVSLLTSVCMMLTLVVSCFAVDYGNFRYIINGSEVKITGYNGNETAVSIPSSLDGRMVTEIGSGAFSGKSFIRSVSIPETVKSISQDAFKNCSSLEEIVIPSAVTNIAEYAFSGCISLKSITILSALTVIGHYAFEGCTSLKEISIPSTKIGFGAFKNCTSLEVIELLQPVSSMGRQAFDGTAWYNSQPEGLLCLGSVVYGYTGHDKHIVIPDGCRTIADFAFYSSDILSVVIPDGMYYIGNSAFADCDNLAYISVPSSVISIGIKAFGYLDNSTNDDFTVYCYSDSIAELWSIGNKLNIVNIDNCVHVYTDWQISDEPDCIVGGVESRRCVMCNDLQSIAIAEKGHSWSGWITISNLTCLTDGIQRRTCTSCGVTEDDVTVTGGHKWGDWTVVIEPDCVNYGESIHSCSVCDTQETIRTEPKGHSWIINDDTDSSGWIIETLPTCDVDGRQSRQCSVCTYINVSFIEAIGHKADEWEVVKDPTAISPGVKQGKCLICGNVFTDSIPPLEQILPDDVNTLNLISDSTLSFDSTRTCLYGVEPGSTVNDILLQFEYPGNILVTNVKLEEISGDSKIGTGCFLVLVRYSEETQQNEPLDTVCVIIKGDANGDGLVTAADARIVLQVSAKITTVSSPIVLANDFDGNGMLTAAEARKILRVSSKLESF